VAGEVKKCDITHSLTHQTIQLAKQGGDGSIVVYNLRVDAPVCRFSHDRGGGQASRMGAVTAVSFSSSM